MKIKNVCNKIISFGTKAVLPGEVYVLPPEYENNDIIPALVEKDNIVILMEVDADPVEVAKAAEGTAELSKKKKAELLEICERLNLPGNQENTKQELCEMIINATK